MGRENSPTLVFSIYLLNFSPFQIFRQDRAQTLLCFSFFVFCLLVCLIIVCLFVFFLLLCLSIYLFMCLFVCLFVYLLMCLFVLMHFFLICLNAWVFVCLFVFAFCPFSVWSLSICSLSVLILRYNSPIQSTDIFGRGLLSSVRTCVRTSLAVGLP